MDKTSEASSSSSSPAATAAVDEAPRVKFLCSFGGAIMPRPSDGRLRYVGGETRIICVPRDVSYGELMAKMRELYDAVAVIKYQQPDEDVDALVSVVNDDDLLNMMEEYDKLCSSGDNFTRLRIFLFTDLDAAAAAAAGSHFDADERETERRYVDALNSLADGMHAHLHQLNIPGPSGHGDIDGQWSPAFYSPGHHTPRDPRDSPSFARYQYGDEFQQSPAFVENVMWLPPGSHVQEQAGFPGTLMDNNNHICDSCRLSFPRNSDARCLDPRWKHGQSHIEQNEYVGGQFSNSCAECYRGGFYNEPHGHHLHPNQWGNEQYFVDANGMKIPLGQSHFFDGHSRNDVFNEQQRIPEYANYPPAGVENVYTYRRNPQGPSYEAVSRIPNGMSPKYPNCGGLDEQAQNLWSAHSGFTSQRPFETDGSQTPGNIYGHGPVINPNYVGQLTRLPVIQEAFHRQQGIPHAQSPGMGAEHPEIIAENTTKHPERTSSPSLLANGQTSASKVAEPDADTSDKKGNIAVECWIPELIASVKKAVIEEAEEVKERAGIDAADKIQHDVERKEQNADDLEETNANGERNGESENGQPPKLEATTAEAEALAKGLQTIKNADLEEIRELGSGTYGAVYHGKWKGCDVAIKRIKASCFAGKPSERERLIADFWKEALILSSLHHPNVVSFYGVVRDGPDTTVATVTEFMVNGSLKQFLQKKDRTIDRRKRLILAMDVAFGMEYLHGKNIVHFDLKCENLLVNMRDPHRPICKIGDLGLSKVKQHTMVSGGVRGTLPWMAPELLSGKTSMVTEKIDVYSFGIVMWELLTGEEPYADMRCASLIGGIVNDTLRPQIPTWCDPEWKALMESCWASDPADRPSFAEIAQKLRKMAAAINVK